MRRKMQFLNALSNKTIRSLKTNPYACLMVSDIKFELKNHPLEMPSLNPH